jgi:hypothetical protein
LRTTDHAGKFTSGLRSDPPRCEPHAPAMTMIKEGADDGSDQTHDTGNRRRGDGDGRSAARARSADRAGRSCHVFYEHVFYEHAFYEHVLLRERRRSHPL